MGNGGGKAGRKGKDHTDTSFSALRLRCRVVHGSGRMAYNGDVNEVVGMDGSSIYFMCAKIPRMTAVDRNAGHNSCWKTSATDCRLLLIPLAIYVDLR